MGAGGFSYEEAAEICGCAVGTIKSRVGRARAALATLIDSGQPVGDSDTASSDASGAILTELGLIASRKPIEPRESKDEGED